MWVWGGLVLGEGESTCLLICSLSPLVWERRTTYVITMRVPNSKVPDVQRAPPFREGRNLARHVPACSKGAKVGWGPGGRALRRICHHGVVGGWGGGAKSLLHCFFVPNKKPAHGLQPCFVVARIGPTRSIGGGGGGGSRLEPATQLVKKSGFSQKKSEPWGVHEQVK